MSDDLCYLPASEAIRLFKSKKLSPVELMQAVIKRAEATADTVNAFTYTHFDEAMDMAAKAEAKYAAGKRTGALEGLPVGIKDESNIKGKPTSLGSLTLKDYVADETSVGNERILRAGGIVHARTATPEFCCASYTHSRLWGVTRNPWNLDYTPGGSSGGSSASLAAGTSAVCTGSDIGGSIRIPAGTCGLVGYKPPYGRNSDDPPFNLDFYCHTGPLARNVGDAILLQNVMSGPSPRDITTLRPKLRLPCVYRPISGMKIAYSYDLGFYSVDDDVRRNMDAALDVLRACGAELEQVDLGWSADILEAAMTYLGHLFGASMVEALEKQADLLTPYARHFAELGQNSKATDFFHSLEVAGEMYQTLGPLLEKYKVLICPTNAIASVPADIDSVNETVEINGVQVDANLGWVMTVPFNMMSRCPVLTMPTGVASNGVPTSIQIVGRTYCDKDVFQVASAYEAEFGEWFTNADTRPTS